MSGDPELMTGVPAGILFYRGFPHWVVVSKIRTKLDVSVCVCLWGLGGWLRVTEIGRSEMNIVTNRLFNHFPSDHHTITVGDNFLTTRTNRRGWGSKDPRILFLINGPYVINAMRKCRTKTSYKTHQVQTYQQEVKNR